MMHQDRPARTEVPSGPSPKAATANYALPISKLRGVPFQARVALKVRRITTCNQLLAAAAVAEDREALARATKIAPEILTDLVQRADMARVNGVGAVFGLMLEELGIRDVQTLASHDAESLHEQLRGYNRRERLARRSPTPEEVNDWVGQARRLPTLLTYGPRPAAREQEEASPSAAA
jgi:predicted flap endonuclease-1-like 5' DNA nuclease